MEVKALPCANQHWAPAMWWFLFRRHRQGSHVPWYLPRDSRIATSKSIMMDAACKMPFVMDAVEMYNRSVNPEEREQILSTLVSTFSCKSLNALGFDKAISKHRFQRARAHVAAFGAGRDKWSHLKPIHRTRLSASDFEEVLVTVCNPENIQDLAFGSKDLRLSSGIVIPIPAVQRKVICTYWPLPLALPLPCPCSWLCPCPCLWPCCPCLCPCPAPASCSQCVPNRT